MVHPITQRARNLRANPTKAEKKLWSILQRDQLGCKFRRQYPIKPYIVDFCCCDKKLIIEVDGGQHNESAQDQKRDYDLENQGYQILRFWNNEVLENIEGVRSKIADILDDISSLASLPPFPPRQRGGSVVSSRQRGGSVMRGDSQITSPDKRGDSQITSPNDRGDSQIISPRLRGDKGGSVMREDSAITSPRLRGG